MKNTNKPECKIERCNVEHLVIRVFKTIKENYGLETARKFYNVTANYRDAVYRGYLELQRWELYNTVSEIAKQYVTLVYA